MTDRSCLNWRLVGHWADPIAGSPDDVSMHADTFKTTARTLERAHSNLDRLQSASELSSDSVAKILAKAREASGLLGAVQVRYDTIGDTLLDYAPQLGEAQRLSAEAVQEASQADKLRQWSVAQGNNARQRLSSFDEGERNQATQDYYTAKADVGRADTSIAEAKAKVAKAIQLRDEAAERAESRIRSVTEGSSINDSTTDKIADFFVKVGEVITNVGKWIWDNLDTICLVIDCVALILVLSGVAAPVGVAMKALTTGGKVLRVLKGISLGAQTIRHGAKLYEGASDWIRTGDSSKFRSAAVWAGLFGGTLGLGSVLKGIARPIAVRSMAFPRPSAVHMTLTEASQYVNTTSEIASSGTGIVVGVGVDVGVDLYGRYKELKEDTSGTIRVEEATCR